MKKKNDEKTSVPMMKNMGYEYFLSLKEEERLENKKSE